MMVKRTGKTEGEVINELKQKTGMMSESSEEYDDMDLTIYEDTPPKAKDQEAISTPVKPYRGFYDVHDYGQSDNEESCMQRISQGKKSQEAGQKTAFYESDSGNKTDDLTQDHKDRKYGRTRAKHNIRYALNRQMVQVKFKLAEQALVMDDEDQDIDDSIVFSRVTRDGHNFKRLQASKKKAQVIISSYMKEHRFEIDERIKERKIARMKKQTRRQLNPHLTGTATILN